MQKQQIRALLILSAVSLLIVVDPIFVQRSHSWSPALSLALAPDPAAAALPAQTLSPEEALGKKLFLDTNLSTPAGQACADCHGRNVGFSGPDRATNAAGAVYEGAVPHRFGNRKPPSAAYAGDSPVLHFNGKKWVGGMFWDGRATGSKLGDPLAEQAQGPFLNPLEQDNASPKAVVNKVLASKYRNLFLAVCTDTDTTKRYNAIGRSIAAYERSKEVSSFTSKYDYWLKGQARLSDRERSGMVLFNGKAKCANCHRSPLFTNFTYANIGSPRNPSNPFYIRSSSNPDGKNWIDAGLGGFLKTAGYPEKTWRSEWGKQKVPTLRNVDLRPTRSFVKAYSHNGYFKSLDAMVHFLNTRDVRSAGWPRPEVAANINKIDTGNLGLTRREEHDIVAFLKTLSDGYAPERASLQ